LPVDTHQIIALVAPRGLFIMDNPRIANLEKANIVLHNVGFLVFVWAKVANRKR